MFKKIVHFLCFIFSLNAAMLSANLVKNSGFEEGDLSPTNWERYGEGQYFWHGDDKHSGHKCYNIGGQQFSTVFQRVEGKPGKKYQLKTWVKHFSRDQEDNLAKIKIEFHDKKRDKIQEYALDVDAPAEWTEFSLSAIAPKGTETVTIALVALAGSMVMFDDVSLVSLKKQEHVSYDLTKVSHDFLGFGTQLWAYKNNPYNKYHSDTRFAALSEMNIKYIRIENYMDNASWKEMRELREQTDSLGIKWVYTLWGVKNAGFKKIESFSDVNYFANEWVKVVRELYNHFIPIEYIELMNEPDSHGSWSTGMDPYWYNQAVSAVRKELDSNGFTGVGIIGPGLSNMSRSNQVRYIENISVENAKNSLIAWSVHPWADESSEGFSDGALSLEYWWEKCFIESIKKKNPKMPIFVTEFSSNKSTFHGVQYPHSDHFGGWNEKKFVKNYSMTNTMPFAARTFENALAFFNKGANAAFFWQLNDEWPETKDKEKAWGFVDLWGKPKPVYEAMKTLASRLQIGAKVLAAPNQKDNAIYTGAFLNNEEIVIGVANSKPFECITTISLVNAPKNLAISEAISFKQIVQGEPVAGIPDQGYLSEEKLKLNKSNSGEYSLKVTLPANSTLTVVLKMK